ncbi:zinc-ribbon domain-containing protein [Sedimentibacter sp. MB35-C1]|uniref:zinc ribbon domain-containing protein n=2 Tax=unclassified Sedimentibacter TaxID=2649220 RepID=UPI0027E0A3A9|nr:zinc ribbon domain-containing protein [Sedimentibacter sp. MB35-C1]WMJ76996.1 zinc-ribbon domain-containing protein [Sedimentibacter sp. MB35-C1]
MKEGVSIMGKFCTSCGTALNEGAKFCAKCGANAFQSNESAQISTGTPEAAKSEQEIPKTMNSTKKNPPINRASDNAPQHSPMGAGKFIITYIRQSLTVLKNPKQMLPTALLGLVWLVLALLGSFGINPLPVRILSFLTFAQGGMFGGVFGAVGGILGKVAVAAFLNAAIVPLLQKKAPFSGIGGGIKGFFSGIAVKSITAVAPLLGGVGSSLLLYAFMNSNQSLQNSMVGIIAFVMLLQNLGRQGGFLWGLAFSAANSLSKGRTPSYIEVTRCISGMTLGFALGVALSAVRLRWCGWLGVLLLIAALIFVIVSKGKKEVAAA